MNRSEPTLVLKDGKVVAAPGGRRVVTAMFQTIISRGHRVLTCRESETRSFLAKPSGVQYTADGLVGGVDIFRRSVAIGV